MTSFPEGENELNNNTVNQIENENENENDNENKNENDSNDRGDTYDETPGEIGPDNDNDDIDVDDIDIDRNELIKFLDDNDLLDMKHEVISSKLKLIHFCEVENDDLDDLCNDLKLSSSQKIRLKHSIKSLQKNMKQKEGNSGSTKLPKPPRKSKSKPSKSNSKSNSMKNGRISSQNESKLDEEDEHKKSNKSNIDIRHIKSKLVIVGEAGVGKTTLQKSMMGWSFEEGSKATFAVNGMHKKSKYKYNNNVHIDVDYEIFDTPGLQRYADIIQLYLRGALAVIVVYDVTNNKSFDRAKWWIDYLENSASGYDKIILCANKIDIEHKEDDNKDDDIFKNGQLYATKHGISFLEISAKNKENINVLLSWVNKQSKTKIINNPDIIEHKEKIIRLHETKKSFLNKINCCI